MRTVMLWVTIVLFFGSMIGTVVGVLMHSGQGGGLSDMFAGGGNTALGSSAAERNLTRITTVFATAWIMSTISLTFLLQ